MCKVARTHSRGTNHPTIKDQRFQTRTLYIQYYLVYHSSIPHLKHHIDNFMETVSAPIQLLPFWLVEASTLLYCTRLNWDHLPKYQQASKYKRLQKPQNNHIWRQRQQFDKLHRTAAPWNLVVYLILTDDENKHPQPPLEIGKTEALQVGPSLTNPKSKSNKKVHKDPFFKLDIFYKLLLKSGLKTISSHQPLLAFKLYQPLKGRTCSMKTTPWNHMDRHGPTPPSISPCPVTVLWRLRCYSWEPSKPRRLWPPDGEPISRLKGQGNGHISRWW